MTTPASGSSSVTAPILLDSDQSSIFNGLLTTASTDLMTLQLESTAVEAASPTLITTTNPLLPDRLITSRLSHMDPDIYDLSPSSHLMKLLKVLMGNAGAGALRRQFTQSRMANSFSGMHFLDLDHFYGALFGIQRTNVELQIDTGFNPYVDATDGATWDDIHSRDASYRDRIQKFANAIYLGGSYAGLRAMVSALTEADCEIYESWEWIDEQDAGIGVLPLQNYTYTFLQTNLTYGAMQPQTWGFWGGGSSNIFSGRTGQKNRSEIIIQPHRILTADETYEIVRVIDVFKPAGTNFTINSSGIGIQTPLEIRDVAASSEYWDITVSLIPNPDLALSPYPAQTSPCVRPAFSQYQGGSWNYNADLSTVSSYTMENGVVTGSPDDETIVFTDGTSRVYGSSNAVMTAAQAASAELVSDGVLSASPYAPARSVAGVSAS
jgi:hypothetical protein